MFTTEVHRRPSPSRTTSFRIHTIRRRKKSKTVTWRIMKVLLHPKVNLRGNHRGMSKRKLYLFEWCQTKVREPRKRASQIVGADHNLEFVGIGFHDAEHALGRQPPHR